MEAGVRDAYPETEGRADDAASLPTTELAGEGRPVLGGGEEARDGMEGGAVEGALAGFERGLPRAELALLRGLENCCCWVGRFTWGACPGIALGRGEGS